MSHTITVYHEIEKNSLQSVLSEGLKKTSRGDMGDDDVIAKTDKLLDSCRPVELKQANVSRDDNLYCYLTYKGGVVDITDGEVRTPSDISINSSRQLLVVKVDRKRCYVSNLDLYDQIISAVKSRDDNEARELAGVYWKSLVRLDEYDHDNGFKRPEVVVTYSIPPDVIDTV